MYQARWLPLWVVVHLVQTVEEAQSLQVTQVPAGEHLIVSGSVVLFII